MCRNSNGIMMTEYNPNYEFMLIMWWFMCSNSNGIMITEYNPNYEFMLIMWWFMCRNSNGIMMTEYNPNYEFGGGSCTLMDLREVDRENLRLVK